MSYWDWTQEGITHRLDTGIGLQPTGDLQGVFVVLPHADAQRLDAPADEEGGKGRHHRAEVHQRTQTALAQELGVIGDHRAAQQVAVTADVLGQAVDHHIHAQIQRIGVVGVAKVLSTNTFTPWRWAILATSARSTSTMVGLAGVST